MSLQSIAEDAQQAAMKHIKKRFLNLIMDEMMFAKNIKVFGLIQLIPDQNPSCLMTFNSLLKRPTKNDAAKVRITPVKDVRQPGGAELTNTSVPNTSTSASNLSKSSAKDSESSEQVDHVNEDGGHRGRKKQWTVKAVAKEYGSREYKKNKSESAEETSVKIVKNSETSAATESSTEPRRVSLHSSTATGIQASPFIDTKPSSCRKLPQELLNVLGSQARDPAFVDLLHRSLKSYLTYRYQLYAQTGTVAPCVGEVAVSTPTGDQGHGAPIILSEFINWLQLEAKCSGWAVPVLAGLSQSRETCNELTPVQFGQGRVKVPAEGRSEQMRELKDEAKPDGWSKQVNEPNVNGRSRQDHVLNIDERSHKVREPKVDVRIHEVHELKVYGRSHKVHEPKVDGRSHKVCEPKVNGRTQLDHYPTADGMNQHVQELNVTNFNAIAGITKHKRLSFTRNEEDYELQKGAFAKLQARLHKRLTVQGSPTSTAKQQGTRRFPGTSQAQGRRSQTKGVKRKEVSSRDHSSSRAPSVKGGGQRTELAVKEKCTKSVKNGAVSAVSLVKEGDQTIPLSVRAGRGRTSSGNECLHGKVSVKEGGPTISVKEVCPSTVSVKEGGPTISVKEGGPTISVKEGCPNTVFVKEGGNSTVSVKDERGISSVTEVADSRAFVKMGIGVPTSHSNSAANEQHASDYLIPDDLKSTDTCLFVVNQTSATDHQSHVESKHFHVTQEFSNKIKSADTHQVPVTQDETTSHFSKQAFITCEIASNTMHTPLITADPVIMHSKYAPSANNSEQSSVNDLIEFSKVRDTRRHSFLEDKEVSFLSQDLCVEEEFQSPKAPLFEMTDWTGPTGLFKHVTLRRRSPEHDADSQSRGFDIGASDTGPKTPIATSLSFDTVTNTDTCERMFVNSQEYEVIRSQYHILDSSLDELVICEDSTETPTSSACVGELAISVISSPTLQKTVKACGTISASSPRKSTSHAGKTTSWKSTPRKTKCSAIQLPGAATNVSQATGAAPPTLTRSPGKRRSAYLVLDDCQNSLKDSISHADSRKRSLEYSTCSWFPDNIRRHSLGTLNGNIPQVSIDRPLCPKRRYLKASHEEYKKPYKTKKYWLEKLDA